MSNENKNETTKDPLECKPLREWIDRWKRLGRSKKWSEIGEEVFARKTLWLAAAKALKDQDIHYVDAHKMAAADVFVEKAQKVISKRAFWYILIGAVVSAITLAGMIYLAIRMYDNISEGVSPDLNGLTFTLMVIKLATIGGIVAGAAYFLIGIARAFLHEGTALYDRRHALRFGRLYVYLTGGKVKFSELESAFNWSTEIHTAFKDIRADKATKSVAQLIAETGIEAVKTGSEKFKSAK